MNSAQVYPRNRNVLKNFNITKQHFFFNRLNAGKDYNAKCFTLICFFFFKNTIKKNQPSGINYVIKRYCKFSFILFDFLHPNGSECVLLFKMLMGGEACTPIRRGLSTAKPKPTPPNERRRGAKQYCVLPSQKRDLPAQIRLFQHAGRESKRKRAREREEETWKSPNQKCLQHNCWLDSAMRAIFAFWTKNKVHTLAEVKQLFQFFKVYLCLGGLKSTKCPLSLSQPRIIERGTTAVYMDFASSDNFSAGCPFRNKIQQRPFFKNLK